MALTRFFREYSRTLVLVIMSLLLVVFLLSSVLTPNIGPEANEDFRIGEAFGKPIMRNAAVRAYNEIQLASDLDLPTPPLHYFGRGDFEQQIGAYLMLAEAEQMGIRISHERVKQVLSEIGIPPEILDALREEYRMSLDGMYQAIARVMASYALWQFEMEAAFGSTQPQLERMYHDQGQKAHVLVSAILDRAFLRHVPEATEEELQAHFEEGRTRFTSHTSEELRFGYRHLDRMDVEYLTIDPDDLLKDVSLTVKRAEAEDYYHRHIDEFMLPTPGPVAEGSEPAKVAQPFEQVIEQAREGARREKAIREAQSAMNTIRSEAARLWKPPEPTADAASQPGAESQPAIATDSLFEDLQKRFSDRYPVRYARTGIIDQSKVVSEPGLGRAILYFDDLNRSLQTGLFCLRVHPITKPSELNPIPIMKVGEPAPVLAFNSLKNDPKTGKPIFHQAFLMRMVQALPTVPATSIDEVREDVVRNYKMVRARALAKPLVESLFARAKEIGLKAAVDEAVELKGVLESAMAADRAEMQPMKPDYARLLGPTELTDLRRSTSLLPDIGQIPEFAPRMFELAKNPIDAAHQVALVPVANRSRWLVGEFLGLEPLYEGDFAALRDRLDQASRQQLLRIFHQRWYLPENVKARCAYRPLVGEIEETASGT